MSRFRYSPPTEKLSSFGGVQTLELMGPKPIARATWQALPGVPGAYQLLWTEVAQQVRRQGHGSELFAEIVRQARQHAAASGGRLRRFLVLIEQPNVGARAWLMRNGFVHTKTIDDLSPKHEVLVMVRTF
jgi:ribosomal protein S18 acetylase RimI-like enzyme